MSTQGNSQRVTAQQYEAIAFLIEGKTQTEIGEELGVHRNTVGNWVRDNAAFDKAYLNEVKRITHKRLPELMNAMMEMAISEGSAAMAKLVLDANGMLTQKLEVNSTSSENGGSDLDVMRAQVEAFRNSGKDE